MAKKKKSKSNGLMGAAILYATAPITLFGNVHSIGAAGVSITTKIGQRDVRKSYPASAVMASSDEGPGGFVTVSSDAPILGHYGSIEETVDGISITTTSGRVAKFSQIAGTRLEVFYDREDDTGPIVADAKWAKKMSAKWETSSSRAESRASGAKKKKKDKGSVKSKSKKRDKSSKKTKAEKKKVMGRKI